ncbi:MAG TPA: enoyl-CoA hydratase-related protein, partial [Stellaceae bacterium]
MPDLVLCEISGAIATITLNQPDRRNPISEDATIEALLAAIGRVDRDAGVRVAILTGAGSAFSTGGDLRQMA